VREYLDFEKPLKELEERIAKLVKSKSTKPMPVRPWMGLPVIVAPSWE
jgi:hypothetical protein